MIIIINNA